MKDSQQLVPDEGRSDLPEGGLDFSGLARAEMPAGDFSDLQRLESEGYTWAESAARWPQAAVESIRDAVRATLTFERTATEAMGVEGERFGKLRQRATSSFYADPEAEAERIRTRSPEKPAWMIPARSALDDTTWQENFLRVTPKEERLKIDQDIHDRIERGIPENVARFEAIKENYETRRKRQIETLRDIASADWIQASPEFDGISSGRIENAIRGVVGSVATTAPGVIVPVIGPAWALYSIYSQEAGNIIEQVETQAQQKGIEMPSAERRLEAGELGSQLATPLEGAGDLLTIAKAIGRGSGVRAFGGAVLQSMVGNFLEEWFQNYPETAAVTWALNPDLSREDFPAVLAQTISSYEALVDGLDQGLTGAVGGGIFTGAGRASKWAGEQLISSRQKRANEQKESLLREIISSEGDLSPEKRKKFLDMLGLDYTDMSDKQIQEQVSIIRDRILHQSAIASDEKNQLRQMMDESGKLPKNISETYFAIWDGMARVGAEQGLYEKPEDFYKEYISAVRFSNEEEFYRQRQRQPAGYSQPQVAEGALEIKPLESLTDEQLISKAMGSNLPPVKIVAKDHAFETDSAELLADLSDRANRLEDLLKCLTS
jgi:hypothetical protein